MKLLAIETSSEYASVAAMFGDSITELTLEGHANHSENLLPCIQQLLAQASVSMRELDAIVYGAGPGAFTGLRLAVATTQGMAMGSGLGVLGICGLDALSLHGDGKNVIVATDARMGEVYTAQYRVFEGTSKRISEIECISPDHLELPDDGQQWFGVGSGFLAYRDVLDRTLCTRLSGVHEQARVSARDLLRLAAPRVKAGDVAAPETATPLYVRNKVALTTAERLARGGRA